MLDWHDQHGRKDLPWQRDATPYHVWVSEIMLQQTQVKTVLGYYQRFMMRFPSVAQLAVAPLDEVLATWTGLGYYARARNLHRAAQQVVQEHAGQLPCELGQLEALPGIGRSTAGAILSLACGKRAAILDGNVKRVLARYHAIEGWPGRSQVAKQLWALAERHTPAQRFAQYTQAIMDLGALVCTRTQPACANCPVRAGCRAHQQQTQHRFPQAKPKTARPQRHENFLLLEDSQGRLLLEKRPESGVWGGLWSFPAIALEADCSDYVLANYQRTIEQRDEWAQVQHQFTHFTLVIQPVLCKLGQPLHAKVKELVSETRLWYKPSQTPPGGLPAPVVTLLDQYRQRQQGSD